MKKSGENPADLGAVRFFGQSGPKPFTEYMHVNFHDDVERALELAETVDQSPTCVSVLAFGYQGNGKNGSATAGFSAVATTRSLGDALPAPHSTIVEDSFPIDSPGA